MHDIIELNTYKQTDRLSLSRLSIDQIKVSIDDTIGISINTLDEPSTNYSIRISINVVGQALSRRLNVLIKLHISAFALV